MKETIRSISIIVLYLFISCVLVASCNYTTIETRCDSLISSYERSRENWRQVQKNLYKKKIEKMCNEIYDLNFLFNNKK